MRRLLLPSLLCSQVAISMALLALSRAAHAQTITSFDPPNSTATVAVAINLRGEIAGTYIDSSNSPFLSSQKGFLRERDGTFTIFQPETTIDGETWGLATWVTDLNLEGEIVGFYPDLREITTSAFLRRRDGTIVEFKGSPSPTASMMSRAASAMDPAASVTSITCDRDTRCIDGTGAFAVNARGEITGVFGDVSYSGFLRQ